MSTYSVVRWFGVRLITVAVFALALHGCAAVSAWLAPTAPSPPSAPVPAPAPVPQVAADPPPPRTPLTLATYDERVKRITAVRADLKTQLVQLELRAVTACDKGRLAGEGCPEIQQLIDRARATDDRLVKALLNSKLEVDWADAAALLRLLVEQSKEVKP